MDLTYCSAYHGRCTLNLANGQNVRLDRLCQETTYSGALEGFPDAHSNDWVLKRILGKAQDLCLDGAKPHLIAPVRRDFFSTPGDKAAHSGNRIPEYLPMVFCIARLIAVAPVRDRTRHASMLTVVWFQDEFAFPILEPASLQLRNLNWVELASDFDW
jgi:hypothetical protein